ncbi:GNAT family N-acetyltransferase [Curtobacterium sp. MCBD17_040]|uniref:GNAT family N-acetyltransferase n=1 Tax=Curtobacterium sp. MCBD17_040 TaxID=2175674 RepID=UPI0021AC4053|nr:GNAT family N-acetyltransferase [Curtobacterium sp. MCBD17_040]WIB63336.1 GNAT family N-acetyltransferase [Curtobacterium sp. MCBD17_040]
MITIERVAWEDPRAVALRAAMDDDMHARYGVGDGTEDPARAAERERALHVDPETVVAAILAVDERGEAVGHIAVRWLGDELELKRLIVLAAARGQGAATALLAESEAVGREVGAHRLVLQTGDKQPEAVALYDKTGWRRIPIYSAAYARTMPFSICFDKHLD